MPPNASQIAEPRSSTAVSTRQQQFEALVRAHSGELYRYAYWLCGESALAQDLVQETFLRAWRSLDALRETVAAKAVGFIFNYPIFIMLQTFVIGKCKI